MFNWSRFCSFSVVALITCFIISAASVSAYDCGDVTCSGGAPDISDVTRIIDYLYLTRSPLCNPVIADVNGSGGEPDISDITLLIDHLYLSYRPLNCLVGTVTDIDGNVYQTVKIGDQWWMAENLKVTRYRNGDPIPKMTDNGSWSSLNTGAYCEYNNNIFIVGTYGRLYNWYAVNDYRKLAPEGWHVPTDGEWQILIDYLGGNDISGEKLKEIGTAHWLSPNTGANNESGFTALPGGYRVTNGNYIAMSYYAYFWSTTANDAINAWFRCLYYNNTMVGSNYTFKGSGCSIRCVRN
ncbi:MAG: fibrobacter succinogenes major paralogous domain-containing protein [Candidatus Zixiibacteriota bacterium]